MDKNRGNKFLESKIGSSDQVSDRATEKNRKETREDGNKQRVAKRSPKILVRMLTSKGVHPVSSAVTADFLSDRILVGEGGEDERSERNKSQNQEDYTDTDKNRIRRESKKCFCLIPSF